MTSVIHIAGAMYCLTDKQPARAVGEMHWPKKPLEGRGSRRNLIMQAAAILNAKYERQRAEWRLVTPLISTQEIADREG